MSPDDLLAQIAARLRKARSGFDFGDMDAETAFDSAVAAVAQAIEETLWEAKRGAPHD